MSDAPKLSAEVTVSYSTDDGTTWLEIHGIESFPELSNLSPRKQYTRISDSRHQYGAGLEDSDELTIEMQRLTDGTDNQTTQKAFLDVAAARTTGVKFKIEYVGETNHDEFSGDMLGWSLGALSVDGWRMVSVGLTINEKVSEAPNS